MGLLFVKFSGIHHLLSDCHHQADGTILLWTPSIFSWPWWFTLRVNLWTTETFYAHYSSPDIDDDDENDGFVLLATLHPSLYPPFQSPGLVLSTSYAPQVQIRSCSIVYLKWWSSRDSGRIVRSNHCTADKQKYQVSRETMQSTSFYFSLLRFLNRLTVVHMLISI